jgi:rhomboid-like protein
LSPAAVRLATLCFVVFLIQQAVAKVDFVNVYGYRYSYAHALVPCFGLNWPLLCQGFVWQPVTYMFLHASWLHLGLNMLTVLLFGSGLEGEVGSSRFWRIFLMGGILGGIGWLAVTALLPVLPPAPELTHWMPQAVRAWLPVAGARETLDTAMCIGASGGVFALIGAYGALFPQRQVYVLLLVFPVKLRASSLAWLLGALTVAEAVFVQSQVAYAAHLAGGLSGFLYGLRLRHLGVAGEDLA